MNDFCNDTSSNLIASDMALDQFYTNSDLANKYVERLLNRWPDPDVLFIEPSAGTGAFLKPIIDAGRKFCAFDIEPKASDILQEDFLDYDLQPLMLNHSAIVFVGNPPFGKNANTAVKFFNHAAIYASEIAFIVPRTFRKISLQKQLHKKMHLLEDSEVPLNSFIRFGNVYDVPCLWQIWRRMKDNRIALSLPSVDHLIRYTTPSDAEFAMRRVGFNAGRIIDKDIGGLSKTSHYFMRELRSGVAEAMRNVDWTEITKNAVGPRSLSKAEIAFKLKEIYS